MNPYTAKIETLISTWNSINSVQDWRNWANLVRETKFGTYGTINIFEVIEKTEFQFSSNWIKETFLDEVNQAFKD
jgi:hypothetical protein